MAGGHKRVQKSQTSASSFFKHLSGRKCKDLFNINMNTNRSLYSRPEWYIGLSSGTAVVLERKRHFPVFFHAVCVAEGYSITVMLYYGLAISVYTRSKLVLTRLPMAGQCTVYIEASAKSRFRLTCTRSFSRREDDEMVW